MSDYVSWLRLPLKYLSWELRQELCNDLDIVTALGNDWRRLASELGYTSKEIGLFENRRTPSSSSATYLLLADFESRNGTILEILLALERMQHIAANVILENQHIILNAYQSDRQRHPIEMSYNSYNGRQNSERTYCNCPRCHKMEYQSRSESVYLPTGEFQNQPYIPQVETSTPLRSPPSARPRETNESWHPPAMPQSELHPYFYPSYPTLCEYCRSQVDPDQTVLLTTAEPKKQCECGTNISPRLNQRQSPVGATSPDNSLKPTNNSSKVSDSSYNTLDQASLTSTNNVRSSHNQGSIQRNVLQGIEPACRPKEYGHSQKISGQSSKKHNNGGDARRSWPSSSSNDRVNSVRGSTSDSQLSIAGHFYINQPGPGTVRDAITMQEIIYSRNPDSAIVYHNNLDESGHQGHVTQNISMSNSCNITNSSQVNRSTRTQVNQKTRSQDNQSTRSQDDPRTSSRVNEVNNTNRSPPTIRSPVSQGGVLLFFTYAWNGMTDNPRFLQDVVELCQKLNGAGARIKIDMDEASYQSLGQNKSDWIDNNMREAKHVIVCITPTYAEDILDNQQQQQPRVSQLNTRYVYDKLRAEYINNNSRNLNQRVIPVMFNNYGTTLQHVPHCMRTTIIHQYPNGVENIVKDVFGQGQYRPE